MKPTKPLFIRACQGEPVERTPIWIMRQAGRYLPSYQAVRAKADFKTMCRTPELAAEVTIQPIEILGFDAAIIFSDILVVPEAMGMTLEFLEGIGPQFNDPRRTPEAIRGLEHRGAAGKLEYVYDALRLTKQKLAGAVPLIGFCGSPWTLATYMIEGKGSKDFIHAKTLLYTRPAVLQDLLERTTEVLAEYMSAQLQAGADALQIFDSWGYVLSPEAYEQFSFRYIKRLISKIKRQNQPIIYFLRGRGHGLAGLADSGADVLGLDWTIDLEEARKQTQDRVTLQGNMDPLVLFATPEVVRQEARKVLKAMAGARGHVFNLGHGILPKTPVENVRTLIETVRSS